jgi:3-oxoacyl-[acyl-carrier-protein] synthase-1
VDSLCLTTLYGFNSLQLVSTDRVAPPMHSAKASQSAAAGFAILEKPDKCATNALPYALPAMASGDAHHMSSPDPQGRGAGPMQLALQRKAQT